MAWSSSTGLRRIAAVLTASLVTIASAQAIRFKCWPPEEEPLCDLLRSYRRLEDVPEAVIRSKAHSDYLSVDDARAFVTEVFKYRHGLEDALRQHETPHRMPLKLLLDLTDGRTFEQLHDDLYFLAKEAGVSCGVLKRSEIDRINPSHVEEVFGLSKSYLRTNGQGLPEFRALRDQADVVLVPSGRLIKWGMLMDAWRWPVSEVTLPAFLIDKYEVCVRRYSRFLSETRRGQPKHWKQQLMAPENPVVFVTWNDAEAYAEWAGGSLPTLDEWERAASGGDGRLYPHGCKEPDRKIANVGEIEPWWTEKARQLERSWQRHLSVVDAHLEGASPLGVLNMSGGVWEWVIDRRPIGPPSDFRNVIVIDGPDADFRRPVKGGSWLEMPRTWTVSSTGGVLESHCSPRIGFRIAYPASNPALKSPGWLGEPSN